VPPGGLNSVLVTGGTDGLGRAAAILLAEHGYQVFAGGRNAEKLASLRQLALQRKLSLTPVELDVCDDRSVESCVSEVERNAGAIDVLVNNAGIAILATMEEITMADLRRQFETNVFGAVRMTQRVLPQMRSRRRGRVVNMSSVQGKVTHPLWGPYSSTKHALEAISDALRLELYSFSIQVILLEPGYIATNIKQTSSELSGAYAAAAESSPYASLYRSFLTSWTQDADSSRDTPEGCARVLLRAIEDSTPRPRYEVTHSARMWILAKRFLPDFFLDRKIRQIYGLRRGLNGPEAR
jgi:NAD(P)-dependent dehydrogenase (short-subunit alcohol dehydrogenase family)